MGLKNPKKIMKIAIYSREIPSTNFIENTILGLSGNIQIFCLGKKIKLTLS